MNPSDRAVQELRLRIRDIEQQFKCVNAAYASSPHNALTFQEIKLIEHLGDTRSRMMRELAEYMLLAVNTVTTTVDNLERKGFVRRQRSEEDRRVVYVELTEAGREAYRAMVEEQSRICRALLEGLNEDEQEIFLVLMRKIARNQLSAVERLPAP